MKEEKSNRYLGGKPMPGSLVKRMCQEHLSGAQVHRIIVMRLEDNELHVNVPRYESQSDAHTVFSFVQNGMSQCHPIYREMNIRITNGIASVFLI